jgi:subtilisin family serine protease
LPVTAAQASTRPKRKSTPVPVIGWEVAKMSTLPTFDNGSGAVDCGYMSGTSMAAPIVSGIAVVIWGQMPPATAREDVETASGNAAG